MTQVYQDRPFGNDNLAAIQYRIVRLIKPVKIIDGTTAVLQHLTDQELIELINQKDQQALGQLYDRYNRLIFSVAMGVVGNTGAAEEITLDVFTSVWQKSSTYRRDRAKVLTWLTRMARNRAIDILRREEVRPLKHSVHWANLPVELTAADHDTEASVDLSLEMQRVRRALTQIPDEQQEALAYAYFKGHSHRQIAEILELPLGTVKARIRLGMQKLRDQLNPTRDGEDG